jgi:spore maturation protein CgeB
MRKRIKLKVAFYYLLFRKMLTSSKVSIAPVGNSYDTYRYWEILLCRTTLIAQNHHTIVPNNFEHKKNALFFSSLRELKNILEYYFLGKKELLRIAENRRRP